MSGEGVADTGGVGPDVISNGSTSASVAVTLDAGGLGRVLTANGLGLGVTVDAGLDAPVGDNSKDAEGGTTVASVVGEADRQAAIHARSSTRIAHPIDRAAPDTLILLLLIPNTAAMSST